MGTLQSIVIDCAHPAALARFWAGVLDGYQVGEYDQAEIDRLAALGHTRSPIRACSSTGRVRRSSSTTCWSPRSPRTGCTWYIAVSDRPAAVTAMTEQGAQVVHQHPEWTVMADPEGNEFCVH